MSLATGDHPPLTPEFLAEDARTGPRVGIIIVNSVAVLILGLRVYARCFLIKCFGWDDGLMCIAGVCAFPSAIEPSWLDVFAPSCLLYSCHRSLSVPITDAG